MRIKYKKFLVDSYYLVLKCTHTHFLQIAYYNIVKAFSGQACFSSHHCYRIIALSVFQLPLLQMQTQKIPIQLPVGNFTEFTRLRNCCHSTFCTIPRMGRMWVRETEYSTTNKAVKFVYNCATWHVFTAIGKAIGCTFWYAPRGVKGWRERQRERETEQSERGEESRPAWHFCWGLTYIHTLMTGWRQCCDDIELLSF